MSRKNIHVTKTEEAPESVELLASSIVQIADASQKLLDSGLTERALIILLHDGIGRTQITMSQIQLVLEALPRLKGWYVKK